MNLQSITPKPLIKLRFISAMSAGTTAKETKVKLTMCDFTCNIFPDMDWVKDLESFVKSPPGVSCVVCFATIAHFPRHLNQSFRVSILAYC